MPFGSAAFHDAICAMTVVTAIPVVKANVRAMITKIAFIIASRAGQLARTAPAFCDDDHVSSVSRIVRKGYKILTVSSCPPQPKAGEPTRIAGLLRVQPG
jgi:hypothetical protein